MFSSLFKLVLAFAVPFILTTRTNAESHTITFVNQCGYGSPALMYNGKNILTGNTYTSNGPWSGIAYLQNGYCNVNGENCTLLETTLINPTCAGCGSSTDISLIPPHVYSVETSFAYYNGCDGSGQTCNSPNCPTAFFTSNDNFVQVECQADNVNLLVSFCAPASQFIPNSNSSSPVATMPTTTTSPSPRFTQSSAPSSIPAHTSSPGTTSSPSSVQATTPSPTTTLTSSRSIGMTTPSSASSPSPSSAPTTSTPTISTPTTTSHSSITTSAPGALNVSPTTSSIGTSNPTDTARRCRPRTSSNPPIPSPTILATGGSTPPKQCGAPSPATTAPMRHRRSRHAGMNIGH